MKMANQSVEQGRRKLGQELPDALHYPQSGKRQSVIFVFGGLGCQSPARFPLLPVVPQAETRFLPVGRHTDTLP
jgi:hypothetical protein